jgi:hypothetical protein
VDVSLIKPRARKYDVASASPPGSSGR